MGVSCSGCGCDRSASRPDASREVSGFLANTKSDQNDTVDFTVDAFPTASSSSKAKTSEDTEESYFDSMSTRAPSSQRPVVDEAPTTSSFVAPAASTQSCSDSSQCREVLVTERCPVDAQESRPKEEATPRSRVTFGKAEVRDEGGEIGDASPTQLTTEPSIDRSSPDSSLLKNGENRGSREEKKRKSWRPSLKNIKRSSTANSEDRDGKKKRRSLRPSLTWITKKAPSGRVRIKTSNTNVPLDYRWLEATLTRIACNQANTLGAADAQTGKVFTPLFFVIGGCPNYFCGMQAIAYFFGADGEVDFWWVKPSKACGTEIEQATLSRQAKGPHKNDPGRSKPFYKPLADMFEKGHLAQDGRRFFIEAPPGETVPRAIIEEDSTSGDNPRRRLWVHLVWQEDWTSNPLSRSKYIKGKIVYQRKPSDLQFYAREYCIKDGEFTFSAFEDEPRGSILPDESIKELYENT